MIRFILTALFVILFLIFSIPIFLVEWIIGKFNKELMDKSSLAIVNWAFRVVAFLAGARTQYYGLENVPKDEAVLYIGNHRSFFDIVVTYPKVPGLCGYIAKKEMEKVPLLSTWMRFLHCLFLDRKDIKAGVKTIVDAIKLVKSGVSVCIFPEGTRSKTEGEFLPFHDGSFKIAQKSGCAIVPMTIINSAAVFENHLPMMKKSKVIVVYGKPFYIKDLSAEDQKQIGVYTQNIIRKTYEEYRTKIM